MAKEKDFIEKLENFTTALEDLVELLKEQQKIGPTEVVNQLLHNLDAEKISMIATNVEEIKNTTSKIVDNQQKVLEELKAIRSQKETGMTRASRYASLWIFFMIGMRVRVFCKGWGSKIL